MMSSFTVATFWCAINTLSLGTFLVVAALEDRDRRLRAKGKRHSPRRINTDDDDATPKPAPLDAESIEQAKAAQHELANSVRN